MASFLFRKPTSRAGIFLLHAYDDPSERPLADALATRLGAPEAAHYATRRAYRDALLAWETTVLPHNQPDILSTPRPNNAPGAIVVCTSCAAFTIYLSRSRSREQVWREFARKHTCAPH